MNYPVSKTHADREALADTILSLLKKKYQSQLRAFAIYGSTARNEDMQYSDIEMVAVVEGSHIDHSLEGIVDGLKYEIDLVSEDVALQELRNVNIDWPLMVGIYFDAKPLYDPQGLFKKFQEEYSAVRLCDFKPFIRAIFIEDISEQLAKYINILEHGSAQQIRFLSFHLFNKMIGFLGVINKMHYSSAAMRPIIALSMPENFPSFQALGEKLLNGKLENTEELLPLSKNLLNEILEYLNREGIEFEEKEFKF